MRETAADFAVILLPTHIGIKAGDWAENWFRERIKHHAK
jgi:hypothetical protein